MSDWFKFNEWEPSTGQDVLVADTHRLVHRGLVRVGGGRYYIDCDTYGLSRDEVVRWMLTPEPPEAGE